MPDLNARNQPVHWQVLPDARAVAEAAAQRILDVAKSAISDRGRFRIVLAGGRTPERAYGRLAEADSDWSKWQIFFGDERCVAPDDAQRNSRMAARAWLDHVPVPQENIHPIPAEYGAETAARAYQQTIEAVLPFDLVLLGMGEDGHTASLFPGQAHAGNELVHAVHDAPKPPPDRVSLGIAALNDSRQVLVLVTGANKREAVARWRAGEPLPIAMIHGHNGVEVLADKAAMVGSDPD